MNNYLENILIPFIPDVLETTNKDKLVDDLLLSLNTIDFKPLDYDNKRRLLHGTINTLPANTLDSKQIILLNTLLQLELKNKDVVSAIKLKKGQLDADIIIWQGDITTLKIDVIVNAANSQLLGCFSPLHSCIDNAIHSAAGVQLRDDCFTLMEHQGYSEPTGKAKITRAYNLPSKYVIHTVGPIVEDEVTKEHQLKLASSYISSLNMCKEIEGIKSIAFCCISTGVFGYPNNEAAKIAYSTVKNWLQDNPGVLDLVIFNVFTDIDKEIYNDLQSNTRS